MGVVQHSAAESECDNDCSLSSHEDSLSHNHNNYNNKNSDKLYFLGSPETIPLNMSISKTRSGGKPFDLE